MSTIESRSIEAEACDPDFDLDYEINEWVGGRQTAERTAKRLLDNLPDEVREAVHDLAVLAVLPEGAEGVSGPSVDLEWEKPVLEASVTYHSTPTPIAAAPAAPPVTLESFDENTIELVITEQAFEPSYGGWNVQFQAVGAPRLSYQSTDPCLEAFVRLEVKMKQLPAGHGTALARESDVEELGALRPFGATKEGAILAAAFGAATVEEAGPGVRHIPVAMPDDELLLKAMRAALAKHLEKVREERARFQSTSTAESYVGRRFVVKKE